MSRFATPRNIYRREVTSAMLNSGRDKGGILASDLEHLPPIVSRYIVAGGWLDRERVSNFRLEFDGEMNRTREGKWMRISSVQHNFIDPAARFFHIRAAAISGRDKYENGEGNMLIKLLSRFTIVDAKGKEMDRSALVTFFNDVSIVAPGALPYLDIDREDLGELAARGTIHDHDMSVTATFHFNRQNELVNWVSNDRFKSSDGKKWENDPWSTPLKDYFETEGVRIPSYGEGIHHEKGGDWLYAKFRVKNIKFNCKSFC